MKSGQTKKCKIGGKSEVITSALGVEQTTSSGKREQNQLLRSAWANVTQKKEDDVREVAVHDILQDYIIDITKVTSTAWASDSIMDSDYLALGITEQFTQAWLLFLGWKKGVPEIMFQGKKMFQKKKVLDRRRRFTRK